MLVLHYAEVPITTYVTLRLPSSQEFKCFSFNNDVLKYHYIYDIDDKDFVDVSFFLIPNGTEMHNTDLLGDCVGSYGEYLIFDSIA